MIIALDGDITRLNNNVAAAIAPGVCSSFDLEHCPLLHPSWMLKRSDEQDSQGGGFHYFSREGAICILNDKDPDPTLSYAQLAPTVEVDIDVPTGQTAPADPQPVAHCDQFCEGPRPDSGICSFTGHLNDQNPPACDIPYSSNPAQGCRFPCKQGTCTETGSTDPRCDCP